MTLANSTILGRLVGDYGESDCELQLDDRLRHLFVLGKSGTGKSTLLLNIAIQDIFAGRGLCLLDPHGDLAEELLNHIPRHRTRDVVYFNLADGDFPVSWNPLARTGKLAPGAVAFALTSAFKHLWRESWGPRMEYILTNCLVALADGGESLLSLPKLLTDDAYRRRLLRGLSDPKVRHFFEVEFAGFDDRQRAEIVSPIQNKVGQLLTHEVVRHIFASRQSKLDLRFMMDNRRILIVNLAKGRVGEEPANLLGSCLLSMLGAISMSRSDTKEEGREPFLLLIDEFASFTTDSFVSILSEIRKYKVSLTLAAQFLDQASAGVRAAIFGNVGSKVLFAVGASDAEMLRLETRPFPETMLLSQDRGEALFVKGDGEAQQLRCFAPIETRKLKYLRKRSPLTRTDRKEMIVRESRRRFAKSRTELNQIVERTLFPKRKRPMLYWSP